MGTPSPSLSPLGPSGVGSRPPSLSRMNLASPAQSQSLSAASSRLIASTSGAGGASGSTGSLKRGFAYSSAKDKSKKPSDDSNSSSGEEEDDYGISPRSRSSSPVRDLKGADAKRLKQARHEAMEVERSGTRELAESNKGAGMLRKMGWSAGAGLGVNGQGRVAPIAPLANEGSWGLGKLAMDARVLDNTVLSKRELESERIARETEEQKRARIEKVTAQQAVKAEVTTSLAAFRCDICSKEYANVRLYDEHTNSYDHAHRARAVALKADEKARRAGAGETEKRREKERRREEKEMRRLAGAAGVAGVAVAGGLAPVKPAEKEGEKKKAGWAKVGGGGAGFAPIGSAAPSSSASSSNTPSPAPVAAKKGGWATVGAPSPAPPPQQASSSSFRSAGFLQPSFPSAASKAAKEPVDLAMDLSGSVVYPPPRSSSPPAPPPSRREPPPPLTQPRTLRIPNAAAAEQAENFPPRPRDPIPPEMVQSVILPFPSNYPPASVAPSPAEQEREREREREHERELERQRRARRGDESYYAESAGERRAPLPDRERDRQGWNDGSRARDFPPREAIGGREYNDHRSAPYDNDRRNGGYDDRPPPPSRYDDSQRRPPPPSRHHDPREYSNMDHGASSYSYGGYRERERARAEEPEFEFVGRDEGYGARAFDRSGRRFGGGPPDGRRRY